MRSSDILDVRSSLVSECLLLNATAVVALVLYWVKIDFMVNFSLDLMLSGSAVLQSTQFGYVLMQGGDW